MQGTAVAFKINTVWKDFMEEESMVPWNKMVWYCQCTPMHAFIIWLAVQGDYRHQIVFNTAHFDESVTRLKCKTKLHWYEC